MSFNGGNESKPKAFTKGESSGGSLLVTPDDRWTGLSAGEGRGGGSCNPATGLSTLGQKVKQLAGQSRENMSRKPP